MSGRKQRFMSVFLIIILILSCETPLWAISISQENEISREFLKEVFRQYQLVEDPEINAYVQKIGEKILSTYPPQPFKFKFYVINSDVYNAFAGPGAQIFVHSGLLEALSNEDELAGIISHEIGHAVCRHISKNIDQSGKIGLGTLAGIAAGIFLGVYGNAAAGSALTVGSIAGSQSAALSFSRDDEMQADKIGLEHVIAAGYDGRGMVDALTVIRSQEWYGTKQIPTYMMTHPALEDRITYLNNLIDANPHRQTTVKPGGYSEFNMIKTKLSALYGNCDDEKARFQSILGKDPENFYAMYGMGIVLSRSGKTDEAIVYLKKALEKNAFNVGMLKTLGKVYFEAGRYINAQNVFEGAIGLMPRDYECNLYMGRVSIEEGKLGAAKDYLLPFASDDKGETDAYYYLSDIYAMKNRLLESYYYLGLYYKNKRDGKNALVQFEMALKLAGKTGMKEKIQTNIDELKGLKNKDKNGEKQGRKGGLSFRMMD